MRIRIKDSKNKVFLGVLIYKDDSFYFTRKLDNTSKIYVFCKKFIKEFSRM